MHTSTTRPVTIWSLERIIFSVKKCCTILTTCTLGSWHLNLCSSSLVLNCKRKFSHYFNRIVPCCTCLSCACLEESRFESKVPPRCSSSLSCYKAPIPCCPLAFTCRFIYAVICKIPIQKLVLPVCQCLLHMMHTWSQC